jgi:hypothetical protein
LALSKKGITPMKKFISFCILIAFLTSCGSDSNSSTQDSNTSSNTNNNTTAPSASIQYSTINGYATVTATTQTIVTGIRGITNSTDVYISGIYGQTTGNMSSGLLYTGPVSTIGGAWRILNYPSSSGVTVTSTSLYGPNNGSVAGTVQIVGNYTTSQAGTGALGLLYQGAVDGSGTWTTLLPPTPDSTPVINTIAHST